MTTAIEFLYNFEVTAKRNSAIKKVATNLSQLILSLTVRYWPHLGVHLGSCAVDVTGQVLFGLQTSLLTLHFKCRNGDMGFWDDEVWIRGFCPTLFLPLPLDSILEAKGGLPSFLLVRGHCYEAQSWLLRRRLMPTPLFSSLFTLSSRLLFIFPTCAAEMKSLRCSRDDAIKLKQSFFINNHSSSKTKVLWLPICW